LGALAPSVFDSDDKLQLPNGYRAGPSARTPAQPRCLQ